MNQTQNMSEEIPAGTSIHLVSKPSIWHVAGRHLDDVEDDVMMSARDGVTKRVIAREFIAQNIEPLERRFEDGERSLDLLVTIGSLEFKP